MQTTTDAPTPPPAPPMLQPTTISIIGPDGQQQLLPIPMSREAIREIKAQRVELSNQLNSAAGRRRDLARDLQAAPPGPARAGLEQRIMVLDKRLAQLESDIAATGKQLTAAPLGATSKAIPFDEADIVQNIIPLGSVVTVFVFFPIALAFARRIWKRTGKEMMVQTQISPQIDQRLERLEQGVDTIAIEIERITEGQRFVTKLLSEANLSSLKLPAERVAVTRD
jgi:hypothetical protein